MSNFDPTSPSYVPPGAILQNDGATFSFYEGNQQAQTLFASAVLSASSSILNIQNPGCRGALFLLNVTNVPASGSATVALKLQTSGGINTTFAQRAAVSLGAALFMVYPGISASAGGVSSPLPRTFNALLSLSTGATVKKMTMSLSMQRID